MRILGTRMRISRRPLPHAANARRRPAGIVLVLGAIVLAGCGPKFGIDAGLKDVNENVRFGSQHSPTPAVPPPLLAVGNNPFPSFPVPIFAVVPGAPSPPAPTALPALDCPVASAFTFPRTKATSTADRAPAPGIYRFRYAGTYKPSNGPTVVMPTSGTREVTPTKPTTTPGTFVFDVTERYNNVVTVYTYAVSPGGPAQTAVPNSIPGHGNGGASGGVYLQALRMKLPDGQQEDFTPQPSLQLLPFPAAPGVAFGGHGTDPTTQQSEDLTPAEGTPATAAPSPLPAATPVAQPGTQVIGQDRVDACGTVLDSWQSSLLGKYTSANDQFAIDDTVDFATQYGGLPIFEHRRWTGSSSMDGNFTFDWTATIDQEPASPR